MSFLFALLTGMGVGSGGLYILWLTLIKDTPQTEAQGLNLIFFSLCVAAATCVNLRYHRIATKPIGVIIILGILSSIPASFLAKSIDTELLSKLFGAFLVAVGTIGVFSANK